MFKERGKSRGRKKNGNDNTYVGMVFDKILSLRRKISVVCPENTE
jgi:hypothetical protein